MASVHRNRFTEIVLQNAGTGRDCFRAPFERAGGELLFNLLTERYERCRVIVTTNLAVGEWIKVFLREMYLAFFQQVQARIARSDPSECVALFSTQLVRWDAR